MMSHDVILCEKRVRIVKMPREICYLWMALRSVAPLGNVEEQVNMSCMNLLQRFIAYDPGECTVNPLISRGVADIRIIRYPSRIVGIRVLG